MEICKVPRGFEPNDFDYKKIAELGSVPYVEPTNVERFNPNAESTDLFMGENLDANTIVSFSINFEPTSKIFPPIATVLNFYVH